MRISQRSRSRGGFTLIELMITVALIGTISAIAIPNFLTYQARSRRTEGTTNVAGIARAYKAYHADRGVFPDMLSISGQVTLPDPLAHGLAAPTTTKMPWDAATEAFFSTVGWRPDGNIFYTYDVRSVGCATCTNETCFTVTAHGDVDGDGDLGAVMYVHPVTIGGTVFQCNSRLGNFPPPVSPTTAQRLYDEPAVRLASDLY